jgi:hypothetical protein
MLPKFPAATPAQDDFVHSKRNGYATEAHIFLRLFEQLPHGFISRGKTAMPFLHE